MLERLMHTTHGTLPVVIKDIIWPIRREKRGERDWVSVKKLVGMSEEVEGGGWECAARIPVATSGFVKGESHPQVAAGIMNLQSFHSFWSIKLLHQSLDWDDDAPHASHLDAGLYGENQLDWLSGCISFWDNGAESFSWNIQIIYWMLSWAPQPNRVSETLMKDTFSWYF